MIAQVLVQRIELLAGSRVKATLVSPRVVIEGTGAGRLLLIAVIGGAVAIGVSSDLRNKVLDLLFGAEEEFDYTSNTTPAPPTEAPAPTT